MRSSRRDRRHVLRLQDGLAERTVRIAERQGQLMVERVQTALREVDLSPEQALAFKAALARQARELTED
jgi:hypothetical protein